MKNKRYVLFCLIMLLTGVMYFPIQAQQKNDTHRTNFSGEWKAKESISMGGNIVCSYDANDRMVSKTMKIEEQADFLIIENPNVDPGTSLAKGRETLIFDGKTRQISHTERTEKKCTVKLSNDGHIMTINSIVYFMTARPYHVNEMMQAFTNVTVY